MLNADKINGKVGFINDTHEYFNIDNPDKKYISVTTLIHKFTNPFDSEFWSAYKALERLVPKDAWIIEKKQLLSTLKFDTEILDAYNISLDLFNKTQQDILDSWAKTNREACERGTKIHSEIEKSFYAKSHNISLKKLGLGGSFECKQDYNSLDMEHGLYPEYLIYYEDDVLRLAGQIDLIIKSRDNIVLADWKTSAKIDKKSGYDTRTKSNVVMKYPLNKLPDCNFYHYSMQLSTYAWMLQKINPDFVIQDLLINHYDHNGKETLYHCDYLKREVEAMLSYYKKALLLNEKRNKRSKVVY